VENGWGKMHQQNHRSKVAELLKGEAHWHGKKPRGTERKNLEGEGKEEPPNTGGGDKRPSRQGGNERRLREEKKRTPSPEKGGKNYKKKSSENELCKLRETRVHWFLGF